ncbi:MAG TPA: hypothetical protein VFB79_21610 [Candidatus Angelobacter sp.]|nr:hypothetical protein [Candidatus Angelobacter sp.]
MIRVFVEGLLLVAAVALFAVGFLLTSRKPMVPGPIGQRSRRASNSDNYPGKFCTLCGGLTPCLPHGDLGDGQILNFHVVKLDDAPLDPLAIASVRYRAALACGALEQVN